MTAMLSRMERGERSPSPESVEALARHFELPVDLLMSETIMQRMLSRYGRKSSHLAAERLRSLPDKPDEDEHALGEAGGVWSADLSALRSPAAARHYAVFSERPVLDALRAMPAETRGEPPTARLMMRPAAPRPPGRPETPALLESGAGLDNEPTALLDPAVERFLDAAEGSLDAAALLALREMPALPPALRLKLVERIAALAEHPVAVLRALARDDDDDRVRRAARRALERLTRWG